jgi:hypothetical protein
MLECLEACTMTAVNYHNQHAINSVPRKNFTLQPRALATLLGATEHLCLVCPSPAPTTRPPCQ